MTDLTALLDEDQRRFVDERVRSGDYPDAAAVLRAGVERLQADDEIESEKEARLERLIQEGLDDVAAGRVETVTDVKAWLDDLGRRRDEAA